jgi:two-component system, LytTR family, sensor kinase
VRISGLVVQLSGWLACGVLYFLAVKPLMKLPTAPLFAFKMGWAVSGFLITVGLSRLYNIEWVARRSHTALGAIALVASLVLGVVWLLAFRQIAILTFGSTTVLFSPSGIPFVFLNHFFLLLAWSGAHQALQSWQLAADRERLLAKTALVAKEAHLEMLRYQINPHFLFNTLTTVRGLVSTEPEIAKAMITELGAFLRATLDERTAATTSLATELAFMERYLGIERIRFDERLHATVECEPAVSSLRVPSFILHPLVENAIRHARPGAGGEITVRIRATAVPGGAELLVTNPGRINPDNGSGSGHSIGLRNVRERLAALGAPGTSFDLSESEGWVRARIRFVGVAAAAGAGAAV